MTCFRIVCALVVSCGLTACGGRSQNQDEATTDRGAGSSAQAGAPSAQAGAPSAQGGAPSAQGGARAAAGASGGALEAGAAGEPNLEPEPPSVDIAGRWALFEFEDPVGVQLNVDAHGEIRGRGCCAGTPPLSDEGELISCCGALSGRVIENRASFSFAFNFGSTIEYAAEAIVSADGQRMTGRFHGVDAWTTYPTAWLRVTNGQSYLIRANPEEAWPNARYDLLLESADPGATEYVSGQVYSLSSFRDGLWGQLGAFWHTELTVNQQGDRIEVGPVSPTAPELAVSMTIELDAGQFTHVTARTASGHQYEFSAAPTAVE